MRYDLRLAFLGGALWLELSEVGNLGIERFMQTLLNLRCTKLDAGNDIYECIIFKISYLITQPQEQRHPPQQQKAQLDNESSNRRPYGIFL